MQNKAGTDDNGYDVDYIRYGMKGIDGMKVNCKASSDVFNCGMAETVHILWDVNVQNGISGGISWCGLALWMSPELHRANDKLDLIWSFVYWGKRSNSACLWGRKEHNLKLKLNEGFSVNDMKMGSIMNGTKVISEKLCRLMNPVHSLTDYVYKRQFKTTVTLQRRGQPTRLTRL